MWTFVGRKKRKVWLWLAAERASQSMVAWVVGRRDAATARRLWQALPRRYRRHCWYFTDLWEAYVGVLPRWQHRRCPKGNGGTSRGRELFLAPTMRRTGTQILFLQ
jgi:insertion element IS1 protein InsB